MHSQPKKKRELQWARCSITRTSYVCTHSLKNEEEIIMSRIWGNGTSGVYTHPLKMKRRKPQWAGVGSQKQLIYPHAENEKKTTMSRIQNHWSKWCVHSQPEKWTGSHNQPKSTRCKITETSDAHTHILKNKNKATVSRMQKHWNKWWVHSHSEKRKTTLSRQDHQNKWCALTC